MKTKIGINGLGRIGRMVVRSIFEEDHSDLKIKHINNRANIETACALLKRDSIHGKFNADISIEKNQINIKGKTTEKLGVIGKEKAIACEVICSVIKYD